MSLIFSYLNCLCHFLTCINNLCTFAPNIVCKQFSCHIHFLYFIAQIARNPSYSFLDFFFFFVNKQINPHNKKTQECILSFLFVSLTLLTYLHINHIKLITNRWVWVLVPTKLVEPGNALAWGGGIHGNPASGPHQALSHWTIQWNTYRPNTYLAHTSRGREGWEKTKAQTGMQTASYCNNTLRRTASKQLRI